MAREQAESMKMETQRQTEAEIPQRNKLRRMFQLRQRFVIILSGACRENNEKLKFLVSLEICLPLSHCMLSQQMSFEEIDRWLPVAQNRQKKLSSSQSDANIHSDALYTWTMVALNLYCDSFFTSTHVLHSYVLQNIAPLYIGAWRIWR